MTGRLAAFAHALFVRDIGLKLVSLAIAVALYALVHGAEDVQRTLTVPLLVTVEDAQDRMLVSELPDAVKVVVRGRSTVVNTLEEVDPIVIDLRQDVGASYHYLEPEAVRLPAGVQVVRIVPDAIPLRWDRRVVVRRPVRAVLSGEPLEGFDARVASVAPGQVRLEGPQGQLGRLQEVRTEPLDVEGMAPGRHRRWVPLERLGPLVRIEPARVEVTVEVVPRRLVRRLPGLVVQVPSGWRAEPPVLAVEIAGPPELVAAVQPGQVRAVAEPPEEGADPEAPVAVRLEGLPRGVGARLEPPTVTLLPVRRGPGRSTMQPAVRPRRPAAQGRRQP